MIEPHHNIPEFSVGEISRAIKRLVEDSFGYVKIIGEVSGFKKATSGHCYFSLKDEEALISCVCFRGAAAALNFQIEDGMQIAVFGKVTTYEGRSNYQIIVQKAEISGVGALMDMIEKRRKKLFAEGLFEDKHKKALPFWPHIIGVITSPAGAVIEDIIHRVRDRFPTNIKLYPVSVQGANAALEIISAIKYFNSLKDNIPNVIIVARGGGSIEDLLAFNDEELVRAVFDSKIPIVSAVGHETDTTLIDYVSDVRAPTPTAAAEIITPLLSELNNLVESLSVRMSSYVKNIMAGKEKDLLGLGRRLVHPKNLLDQSKQKVMSLASTLDLLIKSKIDNKEQKVQILTSSLTRPDKIIKNYEEKMSLLFKALEVGYVNKLNLYENKIMLATKLLDSYHYKKVLRRGYAIIRGENKRIITEFDEVLKNKNKHINIEMYGGEIDAVVADK